MHSTPAHSPAADDNFLIGCTSHDLTEMVASQYPFRWQSVPISVLVWVHYFIEPDVLKTMYRSTIPLRFIWSTCSRN